jgi:hypothetical protein
MSSRTSRPEFGLFANEEESIYGRSKRRLLLTIIPIEANNVLVYSVHHHHTSFYSCGFAVFVQHDRKMITAEFVCDRRMESACQEDDTLSLFLVCVTNRLATLI